MKTAALVTKDDFIAHSREDRENFQSIHTKLDKIASDHPTNGELGIMLTNIAKDLNDVKIQTTKTNGRVTALESEGSESKGRGAGRKDMWGWITAGVAFGIMIIGFVAQYMKFK